MSDNLLTLITQNDHLTFNFLNTNSIDTFDRGDTLEVTRCRPNTPTDETHTCEGTTYRIGATQVYELLGLKSEAQFNNVGCTFLGKALSALRAAVHGKAPIMNNRIEEVKTAGQTAAIGDADVQSVIACIRAKVKSTEAQ